MNLAFDIDPSVLASVRRDPEEFVRELRLAAAVKWYELERVSQGRAAEIAGVSRAEFIDALGEYGVTPFQQTGEEILAELDALKRLDGPENG
jgi:predicted HTH domain antitoxin